MPQSYHRLTVEESALNWGNCIYWLSISRWISGINHQYKAWTNLSITHKQNHAFFGPSISHIITYTITYTITNRQTKRHTHVPDKRAYPWSLDIWSRQGVRSDGILVEAALLLGETTGRGRGRRTHVVRLLLQCLGLEVRLSCCFCHVRENFEHLEVVQGF